MYDVWFTYHGYEGYVHYAVHIGPNKRWASVGKFYCASQSPLEAYAICDGLMVKDFPDALGFTCQAAPFTKQDPVQIRLGPEVLLVPQL